MTPRETMHVIEAVRWRLDQEQRARAWLAWHVAALSRTRTLPPLARLIRPAPAKPLTNEQRQVRKREFDEMRDRWLRATGRDGGDDES